MRRVRWASAVCGPFLAGVLASIPAISWGMPGDGIAGTAHDFSTEVGGVGRCIYCHAPGRATSTALLWNRTLTTDNFTWEKFSAVIGTFDPGHQGDAYYGPTAKCLGCHDGSVAVGKVVRQGEFTASGPLDRTGRPWLGRPDTDPPGRMYGAMSGIHPVATPYPFGGRSTYNGVSTTTPIGLSKWQADPQRVNIRLYSQSKAGSVFPGATELTTGIECSSCHDPHNRFSVEAKFLRGRLAGTDTDYLCKKCHNK